MCKIVAFTKTENLEKRAPSKIGAIINKIEKDGFGYAVHGSRGVFGEKSVFSHFKTRINAKNVVSLPIIKPQHAVFGTGGSFFGPGIFHGRTSTNDKGLLNCHPMQRDNWNLIHNGVVTNHGPAYEKNTTNDSEDVLKNLIDGIEHVEKNLTGYYAFTAIDPFGRLHVCRDKTANLFLAWSETKQTFVFATTESLLRSVAKDLDLKVGPIETMEENTYCVFDGNDLVLKKTIVSRGYEYREARHASASLGVSLSTSPNVVYAAKTDLENEGWPAPAVETPKQRRSRRIEKNLSSVSQWSQDAYWIYRHEIENMDRSYTIQDENGVDLDLADFKRLPFFKQELCYVLRPDGTELVAPNVEDTEAYYG